MESTQLLALIGSNIALMLVSIGSTITLFLWSRAEARNDQQELRETMAADRRDLLHIVREIQEEMKDFHGRLCKIEEGRRK